MSNWPGRLTAQDANQILKLSVIEQMLHLIVDRRQGHASGRVVAVTSRWTLSNWMQ
jgi:hypothetical protein